MPRRFTIVECAPGIYAVRNNVENVFEYVANASGQAGRIECERALALAGQTPRFRIR